MRHTVFLVHLVLWATGIQAFFPWYPKYLCDEDDDCTDNAESKRSLPRQGPSSNSATTFQLVQRGKHVGSSPDTAARAAERLVKKYAGSSQSRNAMRDNQYSVSEPATPSQKNSAGIYQDGTDYSYFVEVKLGSESKPFYMLLDTGAGTSWVMGSDCKSSPCTKHNSFGPADSKTFQDADKAFSIAYGSGTVRGSLVKDTLSVAGMSLSFTFGVADTTSDDFNHFPFDGILGMSRSVGATDNYFKALGGTGKISSNVFGVALNRNSDGPNTGEVTFGGTNSDRYTGDISYTSVAPKVGGDWVIPMDGISIDGKKAGSAAKNAYIDTGTTYIFGPAKDVQAIHDLIPGSKSSDGVTFTVPCDSKTEVTAEFSGVSYTISPKDWMSSQNKGGSCTSNIYGHEVISGAWLLGASYLKNVYAVFDADKSRIGFAHRASASSSSSSGTGQSTAASKTGGSSSGASGTEDPSSTRTQSPGLNGHETAATTGPSATGTGEPTQLPSSAADHVVARTYASIICVVAIMALVV